MDLTIDKNKEYMTLLDKRGAQCKRILHLIGVDVNPEGCKIQLELLWS